MKTIEEYNKEAEESEVMMFSFTIKPEYIKSGLMCPCGCKKELLKLSPQPSGINLSREEYVQCPETFKKGVLIKDGTVRGIIINVEWKT